MDAQICLAWATQNYGAAWEDMLVGSMDDECFRWAYGRKGVIGVTLKPLAGLSLTRAKGFFRLANHMVMV